MSTYPKAEHLHKLQSTKPQSKQAPGSALPELGRPKFPADLRATSDEKSAFRRLCKMLEARRAITPGDAELLRLYAFLYSRHTKAMAKIAEQGEICVYTRLDSNGQQCPQEKPNLWLKVAQDSEKAMIGILDRLGLSPLNKGKVLPTPEPVAAAPVDPLDAAMNGTSDAPAPEAVLNLDDIDEDVVVN